jgi:hypothetical protein
MQELRITQEFDDEFEVLRITNDGCFEDNLILYLKNKKIENGILIEADEAKQIISFLQNYFNL